VRRHKKWWEIQHTKKISGTRRYALTHIRRCHADTQTIRIYADNMQGTNCKTVRLPLRCEAQWFTKMPPEVPPSSPYPISSTYSMYTHLQQYEHIWTLKLECVWEPLRPYPTVNNGLFSSQTIMAPAAFSSAFGSQIHLYIGCLLHSRYAASSPQFQG
jgi:hypothetical protein